MTLIGLDLNATRVRAIQGEQSGSGPHAPLGLPLEGNHRELPLAVSLEERQPRVGRAGAALCRRSPHLACLNFLPYLGDDRRWDSGRHRLDAAVRSGARLRTSPTTDWPGGRRYGGPACLFQRGASGVVGAPGRQGEVEIARLRTGAGGRCPCRPRTSSVVGTGRHRRCR